MSPTPPVTAAPLEHVPAWRAPFSTRVWREQGYLVLALLLAPVGFAWAVVAVVLFPALAITWIGLFVPALLLVAARGWGGLHRAMAATMLRTRVAAPPARRRARRLWPRLGAMVGDSAGWRTLAFQVLQFVTVLTTAVVSLTFLITSLGALTYWFWWRWLPLQQAENGSWHRGAQLWPDVFLDTPGRLALTALAGGLLLFLWAWITLGLARWHAGLTRWLLGPTSAQLRLAAVEKSRGSAVVDADARLRQLERDLHDGTQARLVALSMQLDEAREHLSDGGDPAAALTLVEDSHRATKEAMRELREIARGVRPASLDGGLVLALETLAARAPLPVTLHLAGEPEADPEIEAIAYYCVAELLTNVAKHAVGYGASGALVEQQVTPQSLILTVTDDGPGGAAPTDEHPGGGSGLRGLADRLATVDGQVEIHSPLGGPTVVRVTLPLTVPGR